MRKDACAMRDAAGLGIRRAVIQPPESCAGNGPGTHRAGLKRHVEIVTRKTLHPKQSTGLSDRKDLGMGGRIVQLARAVSGSGNHLAIGCDDHRADGHLAACCGAAGLLDGK